jgi:hypothetical protein
VGRESHYRLGRRFPLRCETTPEEPSVQYTLAALALALGIGGTVALFSVVNGLMIRPLPVQDEDRVVTFWSDYNWRGAEFDLVKTVPEHFESVAAFSNNAYTLRTDTGSTLVLTTVASVELFDVLQVRPLFGRTFALGEDRAGAEPVVILSYSIWEREFASDRSIVGRRINLDGTQTTVVGVMPEGFYFPTLRWSCSCLSISIPPGATTPTMDGSCSPHGSGIPPRTLKSIRIFRRSPRCSARITNTPRGGTRRVIPT